MRTLLIFCFSLSTLLSSSQSVPVFKDYSFDSTYSLVALSSSFSNAKKDPQEYCFFVNDVNDLKEIQKEWVISNIRPQIALEQYAISLILLKNGYMVNDQWLIYPEQGIIRFGGSWYNFDMKKFKKIQRTHALHYHSGGFSFDTVKDFALFRDSLQRTPDFLFLYELTPKEYDGYFNIISAKPSGPNNNFFIMQDIDKELQRLFPAEKFNVTYPINDPFNQASKDKVKMKVECAKSLYDKYQSDTREKEPWIPYKYETKVIFKN